MRVKIKFDGFGDVEIPLEVTDVAPIFSHNRQEAYTYVKVSTDSGVLFKGKAYLVFKDNAVGLTLPKGNFDSFFRALRWHPARGWFDLNDNAITVESIAEAL